MYLEYLKVTFAALCLLLACVAGLALDVTTPSAWAVLAILAVIPSVVMRRLCVPPPQTLSESIREARR